MALAQDTRKHFAWLSNLRDLTYRSRSRLLAFSQTQRTSKPMTHRFAYTLAALIVSSSLAALPTTGQAQAVPDDLVQLDILDGGTTKRGTVLGALRVTLAPGWKTYWRIPGEAGIPPSFTWKGSKNVGNVAITWPTPEVFETSGMQTIGYHDQMILPVEITPQNSSKPVKLKGRMGLGVCKDVCVPAELSFSHELNDAAERNPAIVAAVASRPYSASEAGVKKVTCSMAPSTYGMKITARIAMPSAGGTEVAIIEPGTNAYVAGEAKSQREGNTLLTTAEFYPIETTGAAIDRSAVRITVLGEKHAVDIKGCSAG
ncbi:Thiol-disulfide interchange protein, contains DsbC and DsbD domains [Epibacterium ulvae]|uniref:Thiol-disulfide interchange protein, contains DsbC and DsbD domains n=2 Tax=Epibacterium ulvae TaxID=1156985 RepID=A0A1G5PK50_9RHOB|nr:Thiol-disulfide interchange protein, contains DsbC and DsbD domains [Epibacterium ulvae]